MNRQTVTLVMFNLSDLRSFIRAPHSPEAAGVHGQNPFIPV